MAKNIAVSNWDRLVVSKAANKVTVADYENDKKKVKGGSAYARFKRKALREV